MKIDDITIFNDIRERLENITDEQVDIVGSRLTAIDDTDKTAGSVGDGTRRLYTLYTLMRSEVAMERAMSEQIVDRQLVTDHEERAVMADQIADISRQLAWAQARTDLGFWKPVTIGIRAGWQLVEVEDKPSGIEGLMMRLGGTRME